MVLKNLILYYECPVCGKEYSIMPYAEPGFFRTELPSYCDCGCNIYGKEKKHARNNNSDMYLSISDNSFDHKYNREKIYFK